MIAMRIIKGVDLENEVRPDGRTVKTYFSYKVNFETKNIGLKTTVIPKGTRERDHLHSRSDEIFYYFSKAKAMVNGKIYRFEPGDVLILHANDRHHQISDENDIEILALKIPDEDDKVDTDEDKQEK